MRFLRSAIAAFSCFSAIPMPYISWDDDTMRFMMAMFPLVGIVIGCLLGLWWWVADACGFGLLLRAVGLTLIPIIVSGGIHMDGFADVIDASASHADQVRRQEILKDPHAGAFAILGVCSYLLASVAFVSEVSSEHLLALCCVPVVSRCLSGLATVLLRPARTSGMYAAERGSADRYVSVIILVVFLMSAGAILCLRDLVVGVSMLVVAAAVLVAVKTYADRAFGGMSGDLAGFFLQVAELSMVVCIALVGKLV